MTAAPAQFEIDAKQLVKQLDKLPDRVARRAAKKAVNFGATPIVRAIRQRVQVRTGLTRKSIGKKTIAFKDADTATAIIGARRGFIGTNPDGSKHNPSVIFHLLDRGHIARDGSFVPGTHAVEKGTRAAESAAKARMIEKLDAEIKKEIAKL